MSRTKKPTQIKKVAPSRLNSKKPQLPCGAPEAPDYLEDAELEYYQYFAELFESMKIITQVDREALVTIAQLHFQRDKCREDISKDGYFYKVRGRNGEQKKKNPAVDLLNETRRQIRAWFTEFGLTPASREKVKNGDGEQTDLFAQFVDSKPTMRAVK